MENSYGVGVLNRYALFLDDETDPLDALKAQEQDRERRRKNREAEKENKAKPEPKKQQQQQQANAAEPKAQPNAANPGSNAVRKGIKETQAQAAKPGAGAGPGAGAHQDHKKDNKEAGPKQPQQQRPDRGDRPPPRQPRGPPANNAVDGEQQQRAPRRDFNGERRQNYDGPAGERRGGGGGRGRGGRGGFDGRGKREFDRRSGSDRTGVKPVDKREGGGSHNWGSHRDDVDDLDKTLSHSEGEAGDQEQPKPAAEPKPQDETTPKEDEAGEPKEPQEEEPKELTLDEWKALRGARQKPQYNLRKAGEGEDLSQWKDMVELTKEKAEGDDSDEEYDSTEYPQRVGRQKKVVGIEFAFYEPRRVGAGGRGRGGRGRGGARQRRDGPNQGPQGGQGGDRPQTNRQNAPKVDDNRDFPSLG